MHKMAVLGSLNRLNSHSTLRSRHKHFLIVELNKFANVWFLTFSSGVLFLNLFSIYVYLTIINTYNTKTITLLYIQLYIYIDRLA